MVLLLELPPQEPSQIVENPKTMTRPRKRTLRSERLREDATNTIPKSPGNRVA